MKKFLYLSLFLFCSIAVSSDKKFRLPKEQLEITKKSLHKIRGFENYFPELPPITKHKRSNKIPDYVREPLLPILESGPAVQGHKFGYDSPRPTPMKFSGGSKESKFVRETRNRVIREEDENKENMFAFSEVHRSFAESLARLIHEQKYKKALKQIAAFPHLLTPYVAHQAKDAFNRRDDKKLDKYSVQLRLLINQKMKSDKTEDQY